MNSAEVDEFVADLRRLAAGELGEREFRAKYGHAGGPALLNHIWDGLEHFLADADIRAKDPGYGEMQEQELDRLIELLHEGASKDHQHRITFLGRSKRSD